MASTRRNKYFKLKSFSLRWHFVGWIRQTRAWWMTGNLSTCDSWHSRVDTLFLIIFEWLNFPSSLSPFQVIFLSVSGWFHEFIHCWLKVRSDMGMTSDEKNIKGKFCSDDKLTFFCGVDIPQMSIYFRYFQGPQQFRCWDIRSREMWKSIICLMIAVIAAIYHLVSRNSGGLFNY